MLQILLNWSQFPGINVCVSFPEFLRKLNLKLKMILIKTRALVFQMYLNRWWVGFTQPAQELFIKNASTLVFTSCERFWNVVFGKFI